MKSLIAIALLIFGVTAEARNATSVRNNTYPHNTTTSTTPTLWITGGPGFAGATTNTGDNVVPTGSNNLSSRTGLTIGAEVEFPMTSLFSIQTGLDYAQKGAANGDLNYNFNYLVLPVELKVNFPIATNKLSVNVGPYAALALARSESVGNQNVDASDSFNALDIGARFGAAFEMPIDRTFAASIGVNYDLGFSNIASDPLPGSSVKNHDFSAVVGLGVKI